MITLKPYQQEGVDFLVSRSRAGLFDDMGLGKTYQALFAAKQVGLRVLVIGPPSLKDNWMVSARKVGVSIDYLSFTKIPKTLEEPTTLILEEAHWAQGGETTKRGREILKLSKDANVKYLWLLTGTPMRSKRPLNFLPLAQMLHIIPEKTSVRNYLNNYCDPKVRSFGSKSFIDYTGSSNLRELAELCEPYYLRRMKDKVLGLPPKIYQEHTVPTSKEANKEARVLWAKIEKRLKELGHTGGELTDLQILLQVSAILLISELDKISYAEELRDQTEAGQLYFCTKVRAAKELAEALACPCITGETPYQDRNRYIADFQAGKRNTLVMTIRTAGLGINLTAAEHVIFVGQEWAPEDNLQAEDRAYRIDQTRNLTIHKLTNSLDLHLNNLLRDKVEAGRELGF